MIVSGKNVFNDIELKKIRRVFLSSNFHDKDIMKRIQDNNIKYVMRDQRDLDSMSRHNQGIVVEINDYDYKTIDEVQGELVVMLDHLEDPHNFGAIIRTCECAGVKHIIIPKDRSVRVNETVIKVSTGAISYVDVIMVSNLTNAIDKLKDNGFFVYGADMDGKNYTDVDYADKKVLIIGNEGKGISNIVSDNCDEIISIPMEGKINSLNASVSAGILIYGIKGVK